VIKSIYNQLILKYSKSFHETLQNKTVDEIKIANEPNGRRSDSFIEKITRLVILSRFNQQERIETI